MLHTCTKFRGNWPSGSREENFLRVFTIYGHGGHLGHVTPRSGSLNVSYHKEQEYIWFRGGDPNSFLAITHFMK